MEIYKYETNKKRSLFFNKTTVKPNKIIKNPEYKVINVYPELQYQTFLGFGGAFTGASGICFSSLPKEKQENLIKDYFSEDGINYNLGRLTIGSSDFSDKSYSYSKKPDLTDFSIDEDKKFIIPFIKRAMEQNNNLKFLASPWSPPKFMKSNKMVILGGKLLDKYKQTYADYLSKYIKAYRDENINISYMTVQNEPNAIQTWESCQYSSSEEAEFAINYLYPTFQNNNIQTKILIWDHNKEKLYSRTMEELVNNEALKAISGIAFHWYTGDHFENIKLVADAFPGKLLFHTEICTGFSDFNPNEEIKNAEFYAHDILGDLNSGINAYFDWNLILNHKGGPNHKLNYCNSPVMLNKDSSDYIKTLSYYYIGHFSKFIKPGAKRLAFSRYTDNIEVTSFINTDNSISIVLFNKNNFNKEYNLIINDTCIHDNLDSHAIVTYLIG